MILKKPVRKYCVRRNLITPVSPLYINVNNTSNKQLPRLYNLHKSIAIKNKITQLVCQQNHTGYFLNGWLIKPALNIEL